MKNILIYFLVVFAALSSPQIKAQLVWQTIDSTGDIQRGNYILPSPTGVYVLTDIKSPDNPVSYGGKSHVLHYSNAGVLDWKKKIDLGHRNFEDLGVVAYPKTDLSGNLVYRKIRALSGFLASFHLEKFYSNGDKNTVSTILWGGNMDFDSENNVYCASNSGGDFVLQSFTSDFVPVANVPVTSAANLKVISADEFYLLGYTTINSNDEKQISFQKTTANGTVLWESGFTANPPISALDIFTAIADAVDTEGNIYLLIQTIRTNGTKENLITKTNPEGVHLWSSKISAYPSSPSAYSIHSKFKLLTDDEGCCYLAGTIENSWGSHDAFIVKIDPNGGIIWSKRMGYNLNGYQSIQSYLRDAFIKDGSLYITGSYNWKENVNGILTSKGDFMALKINASNGNLAWKATYLNTPENLGVFYGGMSICAKGLDSIFVTGNKTAQGISEVLTVCFLDHQNVNGNLINWASFNLDTTTSTFNNQKTSSSLTIYPNPATETIQVGTPEGSIPIKLTIYTSDNKLVQEMDSDLGAPINVKELPSGLYIIKVQTTMRTYSGMLMKH